MEVEKNQIWIHKNNINELVIKSVYESIFYAKYLNHSEHLMIGEEYSGLIGSKYKHNTAYEYLTFFGWTLKAPKIENKQIIYGMNCNKCKLYYTCVEANQPDGTHICYDCKRR